MSLDKWIKKEEPEEEEKEVDKEEREKKLDSSKKPSEVSTKLKNDAQKVELQKYIPKCSTSKCNYQRILVKRELTEQDRTCPRCKGKMNIIK